MATPLPPRNRRKTGQQFPAMAATVPAAAAHTSGAMERAARTAR